MKFCIHVCIGTCVRLTRLGYKLGHTGHLVSELLHRCEIGHTGHMPIYGFKPDIPHRFCDLRHMTYHLILGQNGHYDTVGYRLVVESFITR